MRRRLKLLVIFEVGLVAHHLPQAFVRIDACASLLAHLFRFKDKALRLHHIEEKLANRIGVLVTGHFEAGAETPIAAAVRQRIRAIIEELVTIRHGRYVNLAVVMLPTAFVSQRCTSQMIVCAIGQVAAPAPARIGRYEPIGHLATSARGGHVCVCNIVVINIVRFVT